jgi:adenylate kinase family enzyme
MGNEMRQLITSTPTGPAALMKPTLTADEMATLTQTVTANTLAPMALAAKYVKERVFGVGARPGAARTLIDGFPRDVARWQHFKQIVQESWTPSELSVVIVLHASRELTQERFEKRGRVGDSFDKRFDQHEEQIGPIVDAMRQDGLTVIEISADHERTAEELVDSFEEMPAWGRAVGQVPAFTGDDSGPDESKVNSRE